MTSANQVGGRDQAGGTGARSRSAALRALGEKLWSYAATRGGLVFVAASLAAGLSNFVFHVVLSRLLGPDSYGAFGALLNVTSVAAVPLGAISVAVAQSIARRADPTDTPPLGRLLKISFIAGVVATVLWLAATPTIDRFFHLHTPDATIVLGLWLIPAVPGAVLEGVVLGQRRFRVAGIGQILGALVRLASGIALVALGLGVVGGMAATVASGLVVVGTYAWALRHALLATGRFVPRVGDALLSTVALGGAALLTTIDAWLARHFLPAHAAGLFVAAATAGNIALFLPGAITLVYFPRLAASGGHGHDARLALTRATGLVALVGLGTAGAMALVPGLVVGVLFGSAFTHAQVALGTVALADAGIAMASCLIYYHVARSSKLALAAWPTCVAAMALAAAFHGSIETLALDMVTASGALVLGLGIPTLVIALRSLAEETASLPREAILSAQSELDLTIVVPFKDVGAQRLANHVRAICDTLGAAGVSFEVIPVSDGSTDGSEDGLAEFSHDPVHPIVLAENRGKGEALRIGLAYGRGHYLGFIDGDGDIPAAGLAAFVEKVRTEQPDVVVGSKRHRDAEVFYPPLRRVYSTGYQWLCAVLFGLRVRDTQTGVKLVRRDVVGEVLPRMVEKRFAFDLELLAVAHRLGYRHIAELPVTIGERFPSTISPVHVWRMLQDTLATFWRLRMLRFYDPPLREPSVAAHAAALLRTNNVPDALVATGDAVRDQLQPVTTAFLGEAGFTSPGSLVLPVAPVGFPEPTTGAPLPGTVKPPTDLHERLHAGMPLRILILNGRDLARPHLTGEVLYADRVARAWVEAGHQVTWFCAAVSGRPSAEQVDGITVVRRGGRHTVYQAARRYWARQGQGRFDLVVDEVSTRPFEAARWAGDTPVVALVHQVPKQVWFHELPWSLALLGRFLVEPVWLRRLRSVPVLTVSNAAAASLVSYGLTDVTVVPEGIVPSAPSEVVRETMPTVMCIGPLHRNTPRDDVLEAFELLRHEVPGARLWMVGTGPMQAELQRRAPDGVGLLGRLEQAEVRDRLARAHCLVVTSLCEGWRLTVTEAAQVGTPVVAYDVDGLRDPVAASDGLLVAPTPEALADALVEHLPLWVAAGVPPVEPSGMEPWAAVAQRMLENVDLRLTARRRAAEHGEDVAVAWRRVVAPLAAWCDRRAWSVAGIAALVAVAPLSEVGAGSWAERAAGLALGCFTLAVLGTWAEAVRWPLVAADVMTDSAISGPAAPKDLGESAIAAASSFHDSEPLADGTESVVPSGRVRGDEVPGVWHSPRGMVVMVVGILAAAIAQAFFPGDATFGGPRPAVGTAWVHQLALAFSPGRAGAPAALVAVLQLPLGATGSVVHVLGGSAALNERLWVTMLFAVLTMAMAALLLILGLGGWAAGAGAMIYALSPFVFAMSGLAVPYLASMAVVPGLVAWVLWIARPRRWTRSTTLWAIAWLVLAAAALGLVAGSPPLLLPCGGALVGAVLLVGWLEGRQAMGRAIRRTAVGIGGLAVGCAYWAVPFAMVLGSSTMVSAAAHRHWQWAATRATLANGFWLNTSWDWANRAVFPSATEFHHFPLVLWRYALPVAAFASLGVASWHRRCRADQQRLRLLVVASGVALVVVVFATGNRAPDTAIFALATAVPYGWLLQDPGRFLFLAGAAYAIAVAISLDRQVNRRFDGVVQQSQRSQPINARHVALRTKLASITLVATLLIPGLLLLAGLPGSSRSLVSAASFPLQHHGAVFSRAVLQGKDQKQWQLNPVDPEGGPSP